MEDVFRCEVGGESVAAMLVEPMLANGGMIVPPEGYFREVKQLLDKYGILLIADEVQSGNGRTGKMWGIEHFGVVPDVLTTSKAIGRTACPSKARLGKVRAETAAKTPVEYEAAGLPEIRAAVTVPAPPSLRALAAVFRR